MQYKPQPGKQTDFLNSDADITIYGGAAGSGKTYGLLLSALQLYGMGREPKPRENLDCLLVRDQAEDLNKPGSVWHQAVKMMSDLGYHSYKRPKEFRIGLNATWFFNGLSSKSGKNAYRGAQFSCLLIDELTEISQEDFWWLISRMRGDNEDIIPYCRATCNPSPNWVRDLLWYWIDEKTYYPIEENQGKKLWIYNIDNHIKYFDSRDEALIWYKSLGTRKNKKSDLEEPPLSLTFISATIDDNQILLRKNPNYLANLMGMEGAQKLAQLEGCWAFAGEGKLFKSEWLKYYTIEPPEYDITIITTDTASTTKTHSDYTVFQVWGRKGNKIYLRHQIRDKLRIREQLAIARHLVMNYKPYLISVEKAATGFQLIEEMENLNVIVHELIRSKDKYFRGRNVQGYLEQGYVYVNPHDVHFAEFINELNAFSPENKNNRQHDDQVDCAIDAIQLLLLDKIDGFSPNHREGLPVVERY